MAGVNRRFLILFIFAAGLISFLFLTTSSYARPGNVPASIIAAGEDRPAVSTLTGHAIASKLGNETIKAELGRAAWKLFHTTFAQFPDKPTEDESTALRAYIYLFQRLYPCGECAQHFGTILDKYPPQVSSRSAAAAWGCHVHNEVNKILKKELFDCSKIGDFYDCGCAEDKEKKSEARQAPALSEDEEASKERAEEVTVMSGRDLDKDILSGNRPVPEDLEGWVKGG